MAPKGARYNTRSAAFVSSLNSIPSASLSLSQPSPAPAADASNHEQSANHTSFDGASTRSDAGSDKTLHEDPITSDGRLSLLRSDPWRASQVPAVVLPSRSRLTINRYLNALEKQNHLLQITLCHRQDHLDGKDKTIQELRDVIQRERARFDRDSEQWQRDRQEWEREKRLLKRKQEDLDDDKGSNDVSARADKEEQLPQTRLSVRRMSRRIVKKSQA